VAINSGLKVGNRSEPAAFEPAPKVGVSALGSDAQATLPIRGVLRTEPNRAPADKRYIGEHKRRSPIGGDGASLHIWVRVL